MKTTQPNRRKFLFAAGLGTAGVAAAVATGVRRSKQPAQGASASDGDTKYRATEHILKYYKTTKV